MILNDTSGLFTNSTITTPHERVPYGQYKKITYISPKLCPHCGEILEDRNPQYVTFIWDNKKEQRKAAFIKANKTLAEQRGEYIEESYDYY